MVRLSVLQRKVPKTACGFQALIVFAVVGSNFHWQWTEEPRPAVLGVLLAWLVTVAIRDRAGSQMNRARKFPSEPHALRKPCRAMPLALPRRANRAIA